MDLKQGKKLECPKCPKTFTIKQLFNNHVITHDPDAKMKCEVCGLVSRNPVSLNSHIIRAHTNRERPTCAVCRRAFCDSRALRMHMDAMHSSKERSRFPCTFAGCEKSYLNQRHVSRHVKADHAENPVRFPCTLCGKELKSRANLDLHIVIHTTEKPFKCATCGASFPRRQSLRVHKEAHFHGESEILKCKLCPLNFLSSVRLRKHIRLVHQNQRNYFCTFCGKRLPAFQDLKRHLEAIHPADEEKIHSCDKCEYWSDSKWNLALHKRRHEAERLECYFCGEKFVSFQNLASHCGSIHTLEKK